MEDFILFPTVSYALNTNYIESFKPEYRDFVEENTLPKKEDGKIEVKYFAKVEKILEKPVSLIGSLNEFHIWTNEHVKSYLNSKKAHIWILRVYELKEPVMSERTRGMKYANLLKPASLEDIQPVISDEEFSKILSKLEHN